MLQIVEVGVVRDRVTQVNADALPDLRRALMAGLQLGLHVLELLRFGGLRGQLDADYRRQAEDALLGEVERAHARVARPLVGRRGRIVIHRREGQLVQPAGDRPSRLT